MTEIRISFPVLHGMQVTCLRGSNQTSLSQVRRLPPKYLLASNPVTRHQWLAGYVHSADPRSTKISRCAAALATPDLDATDAG